MALTDKTAFDAAIPSTALANESGTDDIIELIALIEFMRSHADSISGGAWKSDVIPNLTGSDALGAAVTGFTSGAVWHPLASNDNIYEFDLAANLAGNDWGSFGPSGESVDHEWSALDALPGEAVAIRVALHTNYFTVAKSSAQIFVRDYGSNIDYWTARPVAHCNMGYNSTNYSDASLCMADLAVDANNLFELYRSIPTLAADTAKMWLIGYAA